MKHLIKFNESVDFEVLVEECKQVFAELLDFNLVKMHHDFVLTPNVVAIIVKLPHLSKKDKITSSDLTDLASGYKKYSEALEDINVAIKRLNDSLNGVDVYMFYDDGSLYIDISLVN